MYGLTVYETMGFPPLFGVDPVSYTHLDVYKRQVASGPSSAGGRMVRTRTPNGEPTKSREPQSITLLAAIPTTGLSSGLPPSDPWNGASKANIPPSVATSQ